MKIKQQYLTDIRQLEKLGFSYDKVTNCWGDECYETKNRLVYYMGHSRRGQSYYLIVYETGHLYVFATKPDGDGTSIDVDDIFIRLIENDMIEKE